MGITTALGCIRPDRCILAAYLPAERGHSVAGLARMWMRLLEHLHNRELVAAQRVGSCVLFSITALFKSMLFHPVALPFSGEKPGKHLIDLLQLYLRAHGYSVMGRRISRDGNWCALMRAATIGGWGLW